MAGTEVLCKSDCQFCQNADRVCELERIEVNQLNPGGSDLNCAQYVKTTRTSINKFVDTDIMRARNAGSYAAIKDRLR